MTIYKIRFERTEESAPENGIRIEGLGEDLIIDNRGCIVEGCLYSIEPLHLSFCINLTSILED